MPKILVALPTPMLTEVDKVATEECRTRSELVRQALREYLLKFAHQQSFLKPTRSLIGANNTNADL